MTRSIDQRADRWRRPGRADARHGPCLARHRRDRASKPATPASRRTSNATRCRRARWRFSAGSASPTRFATPACRRNSASTCPAASRRPGRELSRIKLPSRAGRVRGEKGDDGCMADGGVAAPDQPAFPRAAAVRARRVAATHPHPQSHRVRGIQPGRAGRDRALLATSTAASVSPSPAAISSAATAAARSCAMGLARSLPASRWCSACSRPISARPS